MKKIRLKDDDHCFVCGKKNKNGLKLDFEISIFQGKEQIYCDFIPTKQYQGFADIIHGGIIGLILDEVMVKLLWHTGINALTVEFSMRLKQAAYADKKLYFKAWVVKEQSRLISMRSECKNSQGKIIATATAKCMKV